MSYRVQLTEAAEVDLARVEDHLIEVALELDDLTLPMRALAAVRRELKILETNPFTCRMAGDRPYERELVIPFGKSGDVALFEIVGTDLVLVGALRHQREDDYH